MLKTCVRVLCAIGLVAMARPSWAETFPSRQVTMIVPYSAGGGADIVARIVAQKLQDKWGQVVIVENRDGAGGNVGAQAVFTANPDGYTLLFTAQGPLVVNQSLYARLSYDPTAFVPVSHVVSAYSVLLVNPAVPAKSVKELIDLAKARPGTINYASQGIGTAAHLTAELFKSMAGIEITHVPYRGSGPALTDLAGGHVDMMFGEVAAALPYIQGDLLRALAVSSETRNTAMPDIPTIAETLPGFVVTSWWAIVAPPSTPAPLANQISAAIGEILKQPDVRAQLAKMSMEPVGGPPAELADFIKQESQRWGKVVRDSGAHAN